MIPGAFGIGSMARIASDVVSKRLIGMLLFGNGVRTLAPFTTWVVVGSNISAYDKVWPAGSTTGAPPFVSAWGATLHVFVLPLKLVQPEVAKSPFRYAAVGTVIIPLAICWFSRYCSKLKKKKVLLVPL